MSVNPSPADGVQTPDEWSRQFGINVHDPDGWRRDHKPWSEPLTEDEFRQRAARSTCGMPVLRPGPADVSRTPDTPADPDERLDGFRYFTDQGGALWRVHPPRIEYFDHDTTRWVLDDEVTVQSLELDPEVSEQRLRPVQSFFPEWSDDHG